MKIAVGFVHSPEGSAALDAALAEARQRSATLHVAHSMRGGERHEAEIAVEYESALEEVEAQLRDAGVDHQIHRYARGHSPAQDLLQLADDEDIDLLVIGIRRRSAVGKLLLGSNAQDIILQAPCPVLAVKPAH